MALTTSKIQDSEKVLYTQSLQQEGILPMDHITKEMASANYETVIFPRIREAVSQEWSEINMSLEMLERVKDQVCREIELQVLELGSKNGKIAERKLKVESENPDLHVSLTRGGDGSNEGSQQLQKVGPLTKEETDKVAQYICGLRGNNGTTPGNRSRWWMKERITVLGVSERLECRSFGSEFFFRELIFGIVIGIILVVLLYEHLRDIFNMNESHVTMTVKHKRF